MQKSLKSAEYQRLIALLIAARQKAGIRQQALARKLGKPQSFIAKYEGGERRLDVIEFVAISKALGADRQGAIGVKPDPCKRRHAGEQWFAGIKPPGSKSMNAPRHLCAGPTTRSPSPRNGEA